MNTYEKIGELEGETRRACGIKAKDLCSGVCSESRLKKIEANIGTTDYLTMNRLFSRMGKVINRMSLLLSENDYLEYYYQQKSICLIQEKDVEKLGELLDEYQHQNAKESPLQTQYLYVYMGIEKILRGKHQEAIALLQNAIDLTLPSFSIQNVHHYLLSEDEISMVLLWLYQRGMSGDEAAASETKALCMELEKRDFDSDLWDTIFPKTVWIWRQLALLRDREPDKLEEVNDYCEKVFAMLTDEMRLFYLPQFLKIKIEILKAKNDPEEMNRQKQRDALQKLYQAHGETYREDEIELWGSPRHQRLSIIKELIRTERQYQNLVQEEMAELAEIDQKTLSRIETGKNIPKAGTLQKIMKTLDLEQHLYSTEIDVTDFSLLELLRNKKKAYAQSNVNEELKILSILQNKLPKNRRNQQYLDYLETDLANRQGLLSNEEAIVKCKQIFEQTRSFEIENFSNVILSQTEFKIVILISLLYLKEKRYHEILHLLKNVLQGYDSSEIDEIFYSGELSLLFAHLSAASGELGETEQAISYCNRGIRLQLKNGTGFMLTHLQAQVCFREIDLGRSQEHCRKNYEELYHLMTLWNMKCESAVIADDYEKKYHKKIVIC